MEGVRFSFRLVEALWRFDLVRSLFDLGLRLSFSHHLPLSISLSPSFLPIDFFDASPYNCLMSRYDFPTIFLFFWRFYGRAIFLSFVVISVVFALFLFSWTWWLRHCFIFLLATFGLGPLIPLIWTHLALDKLEQWDHDSPPTSPGLGQAYVDKQN